MKVTKTVLSIKDIRVYARHGVDAQEQTVGNDFSIDVSLTLNAEAAMKYDDLSTTINYAEVIDIVRNVMQTPSQLIEHATRRIIEALTVAFPTIREGCVTVTKLHPPVPAQTAGATFTAAFEN